MFSFLGRNLIDVQFDTNWKIAIHGKDGQSLFIHFLNKTSINLVDCQFLEN